MKRWTIRICVLLLLGAIVNVAVAWGCGKLSQPYSIPIGLTREAQRLMWSKYAPDGWFLDDAQDYGGYERFGLGLTFFELGDGLTRDSSGQITSSIAPFTLSTRIVRVYEIGWPRRILRHGHDHTHAEIQWPGFAINTVFYAAILWLLFFATETIRRWSASVAGSARRARTRWAQAMSAPSVERS